MTLYCKEEYIIFKWDFALLSLSHINWMYSLALKLSYENYITSESPQQRASVWDNFVLGLYSMMKKLLNSWIGSFCLMFSS